MRESDDLTPARVIGAAVVPDTEKKSTKSASTRFLVGTTLESPIPLRVRSPKPDIPMPPVTLLRPRDRGPIFADHRTYRKTSWQRRALARDLVRRSNKQIGIRHPHGFRIKKNRGSRIVPRPSSQGRVLDRAIYQPVALLVFAPIVTPTDDRPTTGALY